MIVSVYVGFQEIFRCFLRENRTSSEKEPNVLKQRIVLFY